jgi:hypothetical protein
MGNDCCRSSASDAVAVPCVYDINFLAGAWAGRTRITLDGNVGVIEQLIWLPSGKISVTILGQGVRSSCTVSAR